MAHSRAPLFLDTAYVYASVNTRDQWRDAALRWEAYLAAERRRLVTTEFVLTEIADGLANLRFRTQAVQIIAALQASGLVQIFPASPRLFAAALDLYRSRAVKEWGLTDCSS
ncbi:MAG TPA: PIN domain-containing protein [Chloroflexota bacterium]|nr:PIN domain-containing protein [Chloroflexota bacterium]